jgi:penicillin-binding protein 1C
MTFQGTVTARRALQMSLNVPAVALLDSVGASRLNARISQAGGHLVLPKGEAPGLAMALGGLGIKLSDLTMLYVGLARGGNAVPLTERVTAAEPAAPRRLLDPVAAWYVGNILIGRRRRRTPPAAASPTRPARPTATATPGRSASTASGRSASGSGGPTGRRSQA